MVLAYNNVRENVYPHPAEPCLRADEEAYGALALPIQQCTPLPEKTPLRGLFFTTFISSYRGRIQFVQAKQALYPFSIRTKALR